MLGGGVVTRSEIIFQTRTACMLALYIDYRPQCVAHAHQVRDLHSMVGRGARTRTFRVRIRVRIRVRDMTFTVIVMKVMV